MKQKQYYSGEIASYLNLLQDDIVKNSQFAQTIDRLFFQSGNGLRAWLANVEVDSTFDVPKLSTPFSGKLDFSLNPEKIMEQYKISFDFLGIQPYNYFTSVTAHSELEMQRKFMQRYYIVKPDFYKTVDRHFFESLTDYLFNDDRQTAIKKVNSDVSIVIKQDLKFNEKIELEQYRFPDISLNIHGEKLYFLKDPDLCTLLLLPAPSFIAFFKEKNNYMFAPDGQIKGVERKNDQPTVTVDGDTGEYLLFNDKRKVVVYNAYIQMVLKLHVHYLRTFEKWLMNTVIPTLRTS